MSKEGAVLGASVGAVFGAAFVYAFDTTFQMSLRGSLLYDYEYVIKDLDWLVPREQYLDMYLISALLFGSAGFLVGLTAKSKQE